MLPIEPPVVGSRDEATESGATMIRVGLVTDEREVALESAHGLDVWSAGDKVFEAVPGLTVRPVGTVLHPWTYRLQVAAMREPRDAERMAGDLERTTGLAPDLAFDAQTGLTRIRLGAWQDRGEAERQQARLKAGGRDAWVVEESGRIADGGLMVAVADAGHRTGTRVLVRRSDGGPLLWRGSRYRGALELLLNRRGELNVVLHTDLEDYLRGVVPREMGPRIYDDMEALKAQAVTARSYVLHNLGEFDSEGFDVCATTRCQAFGGIGSEHPMTDRAIADTAGLVLTTADGRPADTLYTATCGGHTEDVATVFPDKTHGYLRGVPCVEAGSVRIVSRASWTVIESRVVRALVGDLGSNPQQIGESFTRLLERAEIPVAVDRLDGFERGEVRRFLGSILDLVADPAWLSGHGAPPGDAPPLARSLYAVATGHGERVSVAQLRRILYQVGEVTGLVEGLSVGFAALDGGSGEIKVRGGGREWLLPAQIPWHWRGDGASVQAAPGDRLLLVMVAGDPMAVLVPTRERRPDAGAPPTKTWREFRSDDDLARRTAQEFPGFHYQSLELGDRGVSGRLASLRLDDGRGGSRRLEGLAIRWFLEIPETWFQAERSQRSEPGWVFSGRGWGHGVGMCQRGAYRMSLRGARFDEILDYYYTGLELRLFGQ